MVSVAENDGSLDGSHNILCSVNLHRDQPPYIIFFYLRPEPDVSGIVNHKGRGITVDKEPRMDHEDIEKWKIESRDNFLFGLC